ncbi:MAG: hypothetical protein LBS89_09095 [Zoogloeaceae bacterium]|jgi:hypothetical protein|nr:hypothetical protein [Zoogloeaceae bacterium]
MKKYPDYYAEAEELAALLEQEGLPDDAKNIRDAIKFRFTATEILMGIKWHLHRFVSLGQGSEETREYAKKLILKIEKALP